MRAGVLTISDRFSSGESIDKSGQLLVHLLRQENFVVENAIIPDEPSKIRETLIDWSDARKFNLILTTGGTGFGQRDVTPEVTKDIIYREAPGIVIALITECLKNSPFVMISRLAAGSRNETLIVSFPGSAKACNECFEVLKPVIHHVIDLLGNRVEEIDKKHVIIQKASICDPQMGFKVRVSPYKMISLEETYQIVESEYRNLFATFKEKKIDIFSPKRSIDIRHLRLSAEIISPIDVPQWDCSIKDGYAAISTDINKIRQVHPMAFNAGNTVQNNVNAGECARIGTGAAMPHGADCVLQVEDTELVESDENGREILVRFKRNPAAGEDVRKAGTDIQRGQVLFRQGCHLDPVSIGVLASVGVREVAVQFFPVLGVLSTGDELQEVGTPLLHGQVWDSNRPTLIELLRKSQYEVVDLGIARDSREDLENKLSEALVKCDIVVISGGASMGEKDMVKPILEERFGCQFHFRRVWMKPGKPTAFGTCHFEGKPKLIFSLPGNPVSALVTCLIYLIKVPALPVGKYDRIQTRMVDVVFHPSHKLDERPEFVRVTIDCEKTARIIKGGQQSSRLMSACSPYEVTGLVLLPSKQQHGEKMEKVFKTTAILFPD